MLTISVTEVVGRQDVALRHARRQPGRGTHAHDVPDDDGHFGEVRQATEFVHQRNPRTRGSGHGACACPTSTNNDPCSGQFVFGLDDGVVDAIVDCRAQLGCVFGDGIDQAGRRGDGVPGDDTHTTDQRTDAGCGVAVDEDLAGGFVERFDTERVLLPLK